MCTPLLPHLYCESSEARAHEVLYLLYGVHKQGLASEHEGPAVKGWHSAEYIYNSFVRCFFFGCFSTINDQL